MQKYCLNASTPISFANSCLICLLASETWVAAPVRHLQSQVVNIFLIIHERRLGTCVNAAATMPRLPMHSELDFVRNTRDSDLPFYFRFIVVTGAHAQHLFLHHHTPPCTDSHPRAFYSPAPFASPLLRRCVPVPSLVAPLPPTLLSVRRHASRLRPPRRARGAAGDGATGTCRRRLRVAGQNAI
jgi:hypothetical protein